MNFSSGLQIDFWYHMYGSSMGSLYLEENTSGSWNTIWSKSGDQGNSWKNQVTNLSGYSGTGQLRFRVVTASSYRSDVALDDISITSSSRENEIIKDNEETPAVATLYELSTNYPNPFNPTTTIGYSIPLASNVSLKIYNAKGQLVKTLVQEHKNNGTHEVVWNGRDNYNKSVSSGVYYYQIKAGKFFDRKKMILLK